MDTPTRIVSLYQSGQSQAQISRELGVAHTTVRYWLDKTGTPRRRYHFTKEMVDQLPELVGQGLSTKGIARRLGVSDTAVRTWMRRARLEPVPDPQRIRLDRDALRSAYCEEGLPAREVGERLGCSRMTVTRNLLEMGEEMRDIRTPADEDAVVSTYLEGKTISEVAGATNLSEGVVRRVLREQEVLRRKSQPRFRLEGAELDRVVKLYVEGHTSIEIGNLLDVSSATVINALRRRGTPIRNAGSGFHVSGVFDRPLKFGSSWERQVYEALHQSKHRDAFLFQGEYTSPTHRTTRLTLQKPPGVAAIYPGKKGTYRWHPDFALPHMLLEVKGNFWALQHWNRVVLPCLRHNPDRVSLPVWVLYIHPDRRPWEDLRGELVRVL